VKLPGRWNNPLPKALLIAAFAALVLCVAPVAIVSAFVAASGSSTARTAQGAPPNDDSEAVQTTDAPPTITTPAPTLTPHPTPSVTTPRTNRSTATTHPTQHTTTTHTPTSNPTQSGVHPGAFCSPHWAYGHTVTGLLMQCKPSATDPKFRWRKV
jgi:hypothetical protein